MISAQRCRPQGRELLIFHSGFIEAPLCIQGGGKPFTRGNSVSMITPEHPALRYGQTSPCGLDALS